MSRQYFAELMAPVMSADQATVTGTTEAALWPVSPYTAMVANQLQPGQLYRLEAHGVITTPASAPGTLTITPRWGTTASGTSFGASAASGTLTTNVTTAPWTLRCTLMARSVGPTASTVLNGTFHCDQVGIGTLCFGGPVATIDTTTPQGIWIGVTLGSASDQMITRMAPLWAEN